MKIIFFDNIKENPQKVMLDICGWLEIDDEIYFDKAMFEIKNKTQPSNLKFMYDIALFLNYKFEMFFRNNQKVKLYLKNFYFKINGTTRTEEISEKEIKYLRKLYKDENHKLSELLIKHGCCDLPAWLNET